MIRDEFFADSMEPDRWGSTTKELRVDRLGQLRAGAVPGLDDFDVAITLTGLVWDELKAYGTDGATRLDYQQIALAQRALKATLHRVGIELDFPTGFRELPDPLDQKRLLRLLASPPRPAGGVLRPGAAEAGQAQRGPAPGGERQGRVAAHQFADKVGARWRRRFGEQPEPVLVDEAPENPQP